MPRLVPLSTEPETPRMTPEQELWTFVIERAYRDAKGKLYASDTKREARLWFRERSTVPGGWGFAIRAARLSDTTARRIEREALGKTPRRSWTYLREILTRKANVRIVPKDEVRVKARTLTDREWQRIAPLITIQGRGRRPPYSPRLLVDAMLWVGDTGCRWQDLPDHFPDWRVTWQKFRAWVRRGTWAEIQAVLDEPLPIEPKSHDCYAAVI